MPIHDIDPASMDELDFARLVKRTPPDELARLMGGARRAAVLDTLVGRMPGVFRGDRARGINAVVHWVLRGAPDGGTDTYELVLANGACVVSDRPRRVPELTLTLDAVDFVRLVTGNAHPVMLVMTGKMKSSGSARLTAKFPNLFTIPKP